MTMPLAEKSADELLRQESVEYTLTETIFDNADMIADADRPAVAQLAEESIGRQLEIRRLIEKQPPPRFLSAEDILEAFGRGETGDGEILAKLYRDRVIFDHLRGTWMLFNSDHWRRDLTREVRNYVANEAAAQYIFAEAKQRAAGSEKSLELAKLLHTRAMGLRGSKKISNVLDRAKDLASLKLRGDEWDRDPFLLGVGNGVIDLRRASFAFRQGKPSDYVRAFSPVEWTDLHEPAPRWEQFLREIFAGDEEIVGFLQRWFGYCLTGDTHEDSFLCLHGEDGRNGKRILTETIKRVMGAYAMIGDDDLLLDGRDRSAGSPKQFLVDLQGARLVLLSETKEGSRFHLARLKQLTGSDTISARAMYGAGGLQIAPTWKIVLSTNRMPHADADDEGFFERLFVIPMTQRFVTTPDPTKANEHPADKRLEETLQAEASGILAWLLRGCLEWQRDGLNPPDSVRLATKIYRQEQDTIAQFIKDCCAVDVAAKAPAGKLYAEYQSWCKESGETPISNNAFGRRLAKRFVRTDDRSHTYWGIGLLANAHNGAPVFIPSNQEVDIQAIAATRRNKP